MSEPTAQDLAADVREALAIGWPEGDHAEPNVFTDALAALDALVARLRHAEAQVDTLTRERDRAMEVKFEHAKIAVERAEAAEAALADTRRAAP